MSPASAEVRHRVRRWIEVAPMSAARAWAAVCAVGSDIYVIGGRNNDFEQCVDVYKYNVVNSVDVVAYARCSSGSQGLRAGKYDLRCGRI